MSAEAKVDRLPQCSMNDGNVAAYDSKTNDGPWAYLCEGCYPIHGVGRLGTGFGQRLVLAEQATEQTWDTEQLRAEFEVTGFWAPFVSVRRKSDGATGSLQFVHHPRLYFNWKADA